MSTTLDDLQAMTARHADICAELIDDAMAALRAIRSDLDNPASPEARDKAIERMPRALLSVRQCLAMERRVRVEGLKDTDTARRRERDAAETAERARKTTVERKASRVFLTVAGLMEDDLDDPEDAESEDFLERCEDLRVRLSEERFETEFADLPVEEVILRVCRELGVPAPVFGPHGDIVGRLGDDEPLEPPQEAPEAAPSDPAPEPYFRYSSA